MLDRDRCLVRNFKHYCALDETEAELLAALEKTPQTVSNAQMLWEENHFAETLCVLSEGWACSYRSMDDGTRQILNIFLPGDVVGLSDFSPRRHLTSVAMLTEGVICRFPFKNLTDIFTTSPRLTTVLFSLAGQQQAIMAERLVNMGRRTAREKVAHFICEMHLRLRKTCPDITHRFNLPLSQQVLADVLGLSAVHVSRTFSELREEGLLYRERNRIEIPDLEAFYDVANFSDIYLGDSISELLKLIENDGSTLR
ncbi:Crp/Fnr family transcriptional regulator [Kushneria marisflavi]|uniref:Crp/Fnr family transcriptional regulator n=1 Tax=Kushneria marisflavi TaxID=157779 RepID=A0A240UM30_9GAMM|nr:Crp/Fnr family transcriptional regulator [Kushneria marisflavi]ART62133.1 Crp/Fnr family transcriptional regulator [Kushneria marisflavi]RKD87211.1 CRP-like cAMP-binding protein [Kushneria marisflavi]